MADSNGLEFLNPSDEQPFAIRMQNGIKDLIHDDEACDNYYPLGRPFEDVCGGGSKIYFTYTFRIQRDRLKELKSPGDCIRLNPMAAYHGYVMWAYEFKITLAKGGCLFEMLPTGASFSRNTMTKGAFGPNVPLYQSAPLLSRSQMILGSDVIELVDRSTNSDGFRAAVMLPLSLLRDGTSDDKFLPLFVSFRIDEDYFRLESLLPPVAPLPPPSPVGLQMVQWILSGQKPPEWDWVISVSEGSPSHFFVHRKVLADASPVLAVALRTHTSSSSGLLMVPNENRFILQGVHADDMNVVLSYLYLRTFVSPLPEGVSRVGRCLSALFPNHLPAFFHQWQRDVIDNIITMDPNDHYLVLLGSARQLIGVFSAPYGAMPIAKRVAVAAMANALHQLEAAGTSLEVVKKSNQPLFALPMMVNILRSVQKFRKIVSGVNKAFMN